ncbi:helix-turn-helix transcriptional regulator [Acinetobacter bereziniae]|uniref:helix-turn-helix transcriptional regulator n=1 Tax=Acinetobacter bereziniae TaxID=106648 RepID=UPI00125FE7B0|nr:helix-turn-helix transcriptional regulator [Acinetobacter bereziniae]
MNSLEQYYDELVDLIYKIPLNADGWQPFLKKLNRVLGSSLVHILAIDLEKDAFSFSNCSGVLSDEMLTMSELEYLRYPIKEDLRLQQFFDSHRQGWYQCHHTITEEIVEKSALYQNILLPIDMRYTACQEFLFDEKLCILMGINTSRHRGVLSREDLNFLDKLFVHLRRIVLLQRKLYEFSSHAVIGYELINKLSQPIILLNLSGEIVHSNKAAQMLTSQSSIISTDQNKLFLPKPYANQYEENLRNFESYFKQQRVLGVHQFEDVCIKIKSKDEHFLYLFFDLLVSENEMKMFGIRPIVMLTLYDPAYSPLVDLYLLHVAFKLTSAESKVALMLLEGYFPKEIAQKNKVNLDTIRKQMQSIYKKTGTNRQSELIKLLLNMPKYLN